MIKIINNENNVIFYNCSCGTYGKCMFKPLYEDGTSIVNLKCVMCDESIRVFVNQYKSESYFDRIANGEDVKIHWSVILDNKPLN